MGTLTRTFLVLLIPPLLHAAEFYTGQAARAVIGQSSFSSHDAGIQATALSVSDGKLFVADSAEQLLTFDLAQIPGPKADLDRSTSQCAVCGFSPIASSSQPVMPGIAAVSVWGKSLVVADPANHRVLIWRDTGKVGAEATPDVVLGPAAFAGSSLTASLLFSPISVVFDGQRLFVGDGGLHKVLVWRGLPSTDDQAPEVVLGQVNAPGAETENTTADAVGIPSALASDGSNLFVADTANRRILIFSPGDLPLTSTQLTNSATLLPGPLASGALVSLRGISFADESETAPDEVEGLPTKLAGVKVLVNGSAIPLSFASPSEVRAQLPYNLGTGSDSVYLRVEHADGSVTTTNAIPVRVVPAAPGLFAFGGNEPRSGIILHSAREAGGKGTPVTDADPARPGEVVTLWATGLGAVEENTETPVLAGLPYKGKDGAVLNAVRASVDGRPAEVVSATLPRDAIGVYEVRIHLPVELAAGRKTALLISQGGTTSNTVTFASQDAIQ